MFYSKDSITDNFKLLLSKLNEQELSLFQPMPTYKQGKHWTDEYRIRDGHTKLADGSWVTVHVVTTYVESLQKNTVELYEQNQENCREINLLRKQKREMEYGLRVAERALKNSLALTKEMINE